MGQGLWLYHFCITVTVMRGPERLKMKKENKKPVENTIGKVGY
jgi:hypothetical protein